MPCSPSQGGSQQPLCRPCELSCLVSGFAPWPSHVPLTRLHCRPATQALELPSYETQTLPQSPGQALSIFCSSLPPSRMNPDRARWYLWPHVGPPTPCSLLRRRERCRDWPLSTAPQSCTACGVLALLSDPSWMESPRALLGSSQRGHIRGSSLHEVFAGLVQGGSSSKYL